MSVMSPGPTPTSASAVTGERRWSWPRAVMVGAAEPESTSTVPSRPTMAQTKKSIGIGTSWSSPGPQKMTFSARSLRSFEPYLSANIRKSISAVRVQVFEGDPDALDLEVFPDASEAALAAQPGVLVAAKRGLGHGVAVGV